MHKPYLKWVGGKSRILPQVLEAIGSGKRLVEPFVGSAIVALNAPFSEFILSDANDDLIQTHQFAKIYPEKLIAALIDPEPCRANYLRYRSEFNSIKVFNLRKAALFIYLNKHGFNGMCRYNASGVFNIPAGKSNSVHHPIAEIDSFAQAATKMKFVTADFDTVMGFAGTGDTVYCDPPYVPKSASNSDIQYTSDKFSTADHKRLVVAAEAAASRGAKVVISNHDTELTRMLYKSADSINELQALRSISSSAATRGNVGEILVTYNPRK